jgi:hypothetical protein
MCAWLRAMLGARGHYCGRSPLGGGHQDLTSGVGYGIRQEIKMHQASAVSSSPPTSRRASPAPPFDCSWQAGGFGAAWVHVAGEVDLATSTLTVTANRASQTGSVPALSRSRWLTESECLRTRARQRLETWMAGPSSGHRPGPAPRSIFLPPARWNRRGRTSPRCGHAFNLPIRVGSGAPQHAVRAALQRPSYQWVP